MATPYVERRVVGDVLEAGPVAGDEDEVVAALGQLVGERQADAGRRAGHEGGAHVPTVGVGP